MARHMMMRPQARNDMTHQTGDNERTSRQPSWAWAAWITSPSPPGGDGDIMVPLWPGMGSLLREGRLPRVTASGRPIRDWSAAHGGGATRAARSRRRRTSRDR